MALVAVNLERHYLLDPDLLIIDRGDGVVQIGTEAPRRRLLTGAPPETLEVLRHLRTGPRAADAVGACHGDPLVWTAILEQLVDDGLVGPVPGRSQRSARSVSERMALTHRFGVRVADRALTARADSLVVVEGGGPISDGIARLLAGAGVGHVHQRHRGDPTDSGRPRPRTQAAWDADPAVRVYRPAPQHIPTVVVLADEVVPDPCRAAELTLAGVVHLAVHATHGRSVVGPLVVPGRSACLNCIELHRTAADDGWGTVARALRQRPARPSAVLLHQAVGVAASEALTLIDGTGRPRSVGATVEWTDVTQPMRRRRWAPHPACGCHLHTRWLN